MVRRLPKAGKRATPLTLANHGAGDWGGRDSSHRVFLLRRDWLRKIHLAVVRVCIPANLVVLGLVAPADPSVARPTCKNLKPRSPTARLHEVVELIGLAAVFPLPRGEEIHLGSSRLKSSRVFSASAK